MIHRGSSFCTIVEVVFLYQSTVKVILSVRCGEYQNPSHQHDDISVKMVRGVKRNTNEQLHFAELSAHYFWVDCVLSFISDLISEYNFVVSRLCEGMLECLIFILYI